MSYRLQIDLNYREVALLPLPVAKWQESIQLDLGLVSIQSIRTLLDLVTAKSAYSLVWSARDQVTWH